MTTLHDISDEPCNNIDGFEQITVKDICRKAYGRDRRGQSDKKDEKVKTRTTNSPNWRCGKNCVMANVTTADNTWWPKWWPKYDPDDHDNPYNNVTTLDDQYDNLLMTLKIFLMTSEDSIWQY